MRPAAFLRGVVLIAVCGFALGAWWWAVAPASVSTWTGQGFAPVVTEPESYIAADVQFGAWMLVFGVATGWWVRRRWSHLSAWALVVVILGTVGASALAALVGAALGPTATPDVPVGTTVDGPLSVRTPGLLLVASIGAVAWWFAADLASSWREEGDHDEGAADADADADADAGPAGDAPVLADGRA